MFREDGSVIGISSSITTPSTSQVACTSTSQYTRFKNYRKFIESTIGTDYCSK